MKRLFGVIIGLVLFAQNNLAAQTFLLDKNQLELTVHTGINHLPQSVLVSSNSIQFNANNLTVSSDSPWVSPVWDKTNSRIALTLVTSNFVASHTASIRATDGLTTNTLYVHANYSPLNVLRLVDDPVRSRVYGVHTQEPKLGSLIVMEPLSGEILGNLTVGKRPTDLAVSAERDEMLVLNNLDETITVIDLATLRVKETIFLPEFENRAEFTQSEVDYGPGDIIYYSDGAWAPTLHVYKRSNGQILQKLGIDGNGFGDFALTSDKQTLLGWVQYGWGAGWGGSYMARFTVATDGRLTFSEATDGQWPTALLRDPTDTPILIAQDDESAFVKQMVVNPLAIKPSLSAFPSPVYAISPGGEIAVTSTAIYHTQTGNHLYALGTDTPVQVITSDYARLVYFDRTQTRLRTLDLLQAIGTEVLGRTLSPAHQSIVLPPAKLSWSPLPGIDRYEVYLGTSLAAVQAANSSTPEFLGQTMGPDFALTATLSPGVKYFWKVMAISSLGGTSSDVYEFTVSEISVDVSQLSGTTPQGYKSVVASVVLSSAASGMPWTASSDFPWVSFEQSSGQTPATLEVVVDASQLPVGITNAVIKIAQGTNTYLHLPLRLRVEPLALTILKSDPDSKFAYGISENTTSQPVRAYLLEIDTEAEYITRILEVGSSVTDLAIHNADNRLYVPNWRDGFLLAVNKTTFEVERTFPFKPFGGTGYGEGDVYRVSAGVQGRLVVEEQDQWINLSILNTTTGAIIDGPGVREGGGGFEPTGRYYYHGENNSSGATIQKWDVTGDTFNMLASIRVESASYYGSRVVTVSEDGSRIFWNGSVLNTNLVEEWTIGEHIYSSTPDGRYAFAQDKVYDINFRRVGFGMPVATTVSTFNSTTSKLVVQRNNRVEFFPFLQNGPLPKPVITVAFVSDTFLDLAWNDRSLETSFTLQFRPVGTNLWTDIATPGQNIVRHTVSSLTPETAYEFRIKANAANVSSEWSDVLVASTIGTPPTSPTLLAPQAVPTSVALSWSNPDHEHGIVLERRGSEQSLWSVLARFPADITNYTDLAVASGQTVSYRVYATNDWASSAYSQIRTVTVPHPAPPQKPVLAEIGLQLGLAIRLGWTPVLEASSYELERRTGELGAWSKVATLTSSVVSYVDTNIVASQEYSYRLTAVNAVGSSPASDVRTIFAQMIAQLLADDFDPELDNLVWASISGAETRAGTNGFLNANALWFGLAEPRLAITVPVQIQAGTVLEFDFRSGHSSSGTNHWDAWEPGEGVVLEYSVNGTTWLRLKELLSGSSWQHNRIQLSSALAGQRVQFRWSQASHSGAASDTWALDNFTLIGPAPLTPFAPPFLMATPNSSMAMAVFWMPSSGATHYLVQRISGSGVWTDVAWTTAGQNYFTDTNCVPSTIYAYRVAAVNAGGMSPFTAAAFGTTISQIQEWQITYFGTTSEPITEPGADGVAKLSRYAFNLAPNQPWHTFDPAGPASGLPRIVFNQDTGKLEVTFIRRKASMNPGISYEVQFSDDLHTWHATARFISEQGLDPTWEIANYEDTSAGQKMRFCRVVVQLLP